MLAFSPSQNEPLAAFMGRRWMGDAEREDMTVKAPWERLMLALPLPLEVGRPRTRGMVARMVASFIL